MNPDRCCPFVPESASAQQHSGQRCVSEYHVWTHHLVQADRSIPVRARVHRIAVFISTWGSPSGSSPSNDGLHGPPIASGSCLPRKPTRNWRTRAGCVNSLESEFSPREQHDSYNWSKGTDESNITCEASRLSYRDLTSHTPMRSTV